MPDRECHMAKAYSERPVGIHKTLRVVVSRQVVEIQKSNRFVNLTVNPRARSNPDIVSRCSL
jgi:hypothetical protein